MTSNSGDPTFAKVGTLHPRFRWRVVHFVNAVRAVGVPLVVISGRRSAAQQAHLIRTGRTAATRSRHLTGHAIDVQLRGLTVRQTPQVWWNWIGQAGELFGLRWGGHFRPPDVNHFDAG